MSCYMYAQSCSQHASQWTFVLIRSLTRVMSPITFTLVAIWVGLGGPDPSGDSRFLFQVEGRLVRDLSEKCKRDAASSAKCETSSASGPSVDTWRCIGGHE